MDASNIDFVLSIASDIGQLLLLGIILSRRLERIFPVFTAFTLWQIVSDIFLYLTLYPLSSHIGTRYGELYFVFNTLSYALELAVLLEVGANVVRPGKGLLSKGVQRPFLGFVLAVGIMSFIFTSWISPEFFIKFRVFLAMDIIAAALCVALFLLVAGFSQVLGLNWRNHVLQLTTGLAFFSVIDLLAQFIHGELHRGPAYDYYYQLWNRIDVAGYLCTLYFWCWAFAKKEAPRRDFSPQMARFLASLSGSAKRQNAVLARSRDE